MRERCKLDVGVVNHIFLHLYGHFITTARSKSNDKMLLILCFLSPLHAYCRLPHRGVCLRSKWCAPADVISFLFNENKMVSDIFK